MTQRSRIDIRANFIVGEVECWLVWRNVIGRTGEGESAVGPFAEVGRVGVDEEGKVELDQG